MTYTELEAQNETGLLAIMSNDSAEHGMRVYAAVLLYKRGSRFLAFEEFRKFRPDVMDYILEEHSKAPLKPFAPNVTTDMAGRLHDRMTEANTRLDQHTDSVRVVQGHLETIQQQHSAHYDEHKQNLHESVQELHERLDNHESVLDDHESTTSAVAETTAKAFEAVRDVTAELGKQIDRTNKNQSEIAQRHQEQHDAHAERTIRRLAEHDVQIHRVEKVRDEADDQIIRNLDEHKQNTRESLSTLTVGLVKQRELIETNQKQTEESLLAALIARQRADEILSAELAYLKKVLWYVAPSLFVLSQIGSYLIKHFVR